MSQSKTSRARQTGVSGHEFISRWSSLKHQARQHPDQTDIDVVKNNAAANTIDPDNKNQPAPLTDADMPDIDSLTPDSSFSEFLSPGVSEELRKLALKKLFHSEVFNIRDGLDEYDGDYTQFEQLGDVVTADMQHQIEMEARRKAEQMLNADDQIADSEGLDRDEAEGLQLGSDQQPSAAADEAEPDEDRDPAYASLTDELSGTAAPVEKRGSAIEAGEDDE